MLRCGWCKVWLKTLGGRKSRGALRHSVQFVARASANEVFSCRSWWI